MLGFSRGSDEELEPCEINPVVDNTIQLLGDRFLREVELRFDRGPDLPCLRASQSLIQQILLNFIFNAAESMNGRKRIVITTARPGPLPAGMALPPGRGGGLCLGFGARFWLRDSAREHRAGVRAVFYDQSPVHTARHRVGPLHCL